MLKLLFTLGVFLLLSLAVLGLRQHRLEVTSQTARLHDQIKVREQTLWDQRVQIAKSTNPLALAVNLKTAGMSAGEAMQPRSTGRRTPGSTAGAPSHGPETDLAASLGAPPAAGAPGHSDPRRPRQ